MTAVEVTGVAIPRFSRREISAFTRQALLAIANLAGQASRLQSVSVAFVDDAAMMELNRKFRRKHRTTDVLTFRDDDLGEIVISADQARRQAIDERHALATEVRYLILHGLLHALGYDHETDQGEMNEMEVEVRERVGLE